MELKPNDMLLFTKLSIHGIGPVLLQFLQLKNATPFPFSADVILDNNHLAKTQKRKHPARHTIFKLF